MLSREEQEGRLSENRFSSIIAINAQGWKNILAPSNSLPKSKWKLGEDVILVENGEYECKACNNLIAQYHRLNK